MTPYASVIIPTHNRAATLATAVESVRRQSVRDLEIILSGDGATAEVRGIAEALARADDRIRFLDHPKGPERGFANRDRAVHKARSDRIFYIDDDDLWLPDHVARLGPLLDDADIADSLVASVGFSGILHVSLTDNSEPGPRQDFAAGIGKTVFDTHLAHRKSAYLRVARTWSVGPRLLFASFAADPAIRWRSIGVVTALSLHGAARAAMTDGERRAEILQWLSRLDDLQRRGVLSLAKPAWWAFHTACSRGAIDEARPSFVILSEAQRSDFRAANSLATGQAIGEADWPNLLRQLFDCVLKEASCELLADRLSGALGVTAALTKLRAFADAAPKHAGRTGLVRAYILQAAGGDPAEIEAAVAPTLSDSAQWRAEALLILASLRAPHDIEAAADLAETATGLAPEISQAWMRQFEYSLRAGRPDAARHAIEGLRALTTAGKPARAQRVAKMELALQRHREQATAREAKVAAWALHRSQKAAAMEAKIAAREQKSQVQAAKAEAKALKAASRRQPSAK